MRYEVKLMNRNLTNENKVVFVTENKSEAFRFATRVKNHENIRPICEYDDVSIFDNCTCIARIALY